jgi:transcriptional regulator with XRE-family HTH domain
VHFPDPCALGALVTARRRALGLDLLEVSRRSGVALLDLMRVEQGEGAPPAREGFAALAAALGFGSARRLLWAVCGEDRGPDETGGPPATAAAAERFLRGAGRGGA